MPSGFVSCAVLNSSREKMAEKQLTSFGWTTPERSQVAKHGLVVTCSSSSPAVAGCCVDICAAVRLCVFCDSRAVSDFSATNFGQAAERFVHALIQSAADKSTSVSQGMSVQPAVLT